MTGVYPHKHGVLKNTGIPKTRRECEVLPGTTMLQDWAKKNTNYELAYFGKWHIGNDDVLMNSNFDFKKPQIHPKGNTHHPGPWLGEISYSIANGRAGLVKCPVNEYPDVVVASDTCDYLEHRNKANNFLLFCSFPGPHDPWLIPEEYGIKYSPEDIPLWSNIHEKEKLEDAKPHIQKFRKLLDSLYCSGASDREREAVLREALAFQFTYVDLIDKQIGRVLDCLEKHGLYENTHIIFTADHGSMSGAHDRINKGTYMYNETYRVPLLYKKAGRPVSGKSGKTVSLLDVTASIMHIMSGSEKTEMSGHYLDGKSFITQLEKDVQNSDDDFYYAEYHGDDYGGYSSRMVTNGKWKLVWNFTDKCELYNLENDPGELNNLFYVEDCKNKCNELLEVILKKAEVYEDREVYLWARLLKKSGFEHVLKCGPKMQNVNR
jgi:arylsulfatase A-like enzyme